MHDAILKLEDELTKLIKVISASLMKDATPDDLALMSQQAAAASVASSPTLGSNGAPTAASDGMSEFGRLQCMPGYNRLQRQLFFNLMTARPDVSQHNIRIEHDIHKPRKPYSATAVISTVDVPSPRAKFTGYIRKESSKELGAKEFDLSLIGQVEEEDSMDRATVKNISKLIYERDRDQFKPANV